VGVVADLDIGQHVGALVGHEDPQVLHGTLELQVSEVEATGQVVAGSSPVLDLLQE
jgi:hypothetical protein